MATGDADAFKSPRRWGGFLCIVAGITLGFIDAFSETYALDAISFGLLMGTGAILLGVDPIISRLGR